MIPIIPHITDGDYDLDSVFKMAKMINVNYILPGLLNLYGETKTHFFRIIKNSFKNSFNDLKNTYISSKASKIYNMKFYNKITILNKRYDFKDSYKTVLDRKLNEFNLKDNTKQSTLFDTF
ncbi:hypothetical protein [Methanobrevibacter filiformis]|uniref:Uncharacterized protein n=1 Tax=Methanobrevibacter filiformis TaxID=55758 RepID=A0A166F680_9EURY|nr:hypothetical protein [Methanobrevibacter filiformis]KZX17355.1 hypothetical protein MBFIL_01970 [Methanobrevibacter filiformis]